MARPGADCANATPPPMRSESGGWPCEHNRTAHAIGAPQAPLPLWVGCPVYADLLVTEMDGRGILRYRVTEAWAGGGQGWGAAIDPSICQELQAEVGYSVSRVWCLVAVGRCRCYDFGTTKGWGNPPLQGRSSPHCHPPTPAGHEKHQRAKEYDRWVAEVGVNRLETLNLVLPSPVPASAWDPKVPPAPCSP